MQWLQLVASVATGLIITIPLINKLVEYVKKAAKEKNWNKMLSMVMTYMETAEEMFDSGADRKEWVLSMIKASANTIDYDIDMDVINQLIDDLCDMSKVINVVSEIGEAGE